MTTISYLLKPVQPIDSFDQSNGTPEDNDLEAIGLVVEAVENVVNNGDFFPSSQDGWSNESVVKIFDLDKEAKKTHEEGGLGMEQKLHEIAEEVFEAASDLDLVAFFDGEAGMFFIFDAPAPDEYEDLLVIQRGRVWQITNSVGSHFVGGDFSSEVAAIVEAFASMDDFFPNVYVALSDGSYQIVTDFKITE